MNLDEYQRKAVETESDRALVIAPPGGGKTRVLTERIAYLIQEKQVSGYEIIAFSFTRKASNEIMNRLNSREDLKPAIESIESGTMHAIGLKYLKRFGEMVGINARQLTVYGPWEEKFLLKEIAKELGLYKNTWKIPKKDIDHLFDTYYNQGIMPAEGEKGCVLFNTFFERCKENHAITYGGLLVGLYILIPKIARHVHFRHLLVDEVQDMNIIQWKIIHAMEYHWKTSLFCVGDIDQCIYEWRGSDPLHIVDRQDDYDVFKLAYNYRSMPGIVKASDRLIKNNLYRIIKPMISVRSPTQSEIVIAKNVDSEKLVEILQVLDGIGVAILCRIHNPLKKLSRLLEDANIDHVYCGKKADMINTEEFQRYHAFLKLLINPFDNFAFLLVKDLIGLTADQYRAVRIEASECYQSHFQAYNNLFKDNLFQNYKELESNHNLKLLAIEIGDLFLKPDWQNRIDAENFFDGWIRKNPRGTIEDYHDYIATYDLQDEVDDDHTGIKLMTVHAAKGLEWSRVIIAGCNEGIMPTKSADANGTIEEERRICYVAMTRAMDGLMLTIRPEEKKDESGKIYRSPVSRFMKEALVEKV